MVPQNTKRTERSGIRKIKTRKNIINQTFSNCGTSTTSVPKQLLRGTVGSHSYYTTLIAHFQQTPFLHSRTFPSLLRGSRKGNAFWRLLKLKTGITRMTVHQLTTTFPYLSFITESLLVILQSQVLSF